MPFNLSVDLNASGAYNGRYDFLQGDAGIRSYYFGGSRESDQIHFTVIVADIFTKFHITKTFVLQSGKTSTSINFHIYYFYDNAQRTTLYSGNNLSEIPTMGGRRTTVENWYTTSGNAQALNQAAGEFAQKVQSQPIAMAKAGGARRAIVASVRPANTVAIDLSTTPIMSQANAVGQGFDIYKSFDLSSLLHPLIDFSKAGTQIFTFLGTDYLIPAIITAVQNTASYYLGGTFASRESFQDSIAAHAGVQGSYGAFSGEMKVDFAGEYSGSSNYSFAYNDFYSQLAYLELTQPQFQTSAFLQQVGELPDIADADTLPAFEAFFELYGIYYVQKVVIGGVLEFYTAVSNLSELAQTDITAMFKAQYNGLFSSGSIDTNTKNSQKWQSYVQFSQSSIRSAGGSPQAVAALTAVDPTQPSTSTVSAFQAWAQSISSDPAIVDFALHGIWELCGSKSAVVQAAWQLYGQKMRPELVVQTSSQEMDQGWSGQPVVPMIMIGGNVMPAPAASSPCGYRLMILGGTDITEPSDVLLDQCFTLPMSPPIWSSTYQNLYTSMINAITSNGLSSTGNILVLASFGLDNDMPPTPAFVNLLQSAGAGNQLQSWLSCSDAGSMPGSAAPWISYPTDYILTGVFGSGPNSGVEIYNYPNVVPFNQPVSDRLQVIFYRQTINGQYTVSIDNS
jgi:hypothetical protein